MRQIEVRCAVCGSLQQAAELTSTSSFGPPDLDLRPNGPARWALPFNVQRCEGCGYAATSIGVAPPGAVETVGSVVYRGVLERSKLPSLARTYFCAALVEESAGRDEGAGWAFLSAAWACDDAGATRHARSCRERAAEMLTRALDNGALEMPRGVAQTLVAELWRRAARADEALAACEAAEQELAEHAATDEDDERSPTAAVIELVVP
jgi:hypothetical protein